MRIEEKEGVTGYVQLMLNGAEVGKHNLVLTAGKQWIASRIAGGGTGASHIAVGSGATPAALANTGLEAEIARKAVVVPGGVASGNTVTYEVTFDETEGNGELREASLNLAATGATAVARVVFPIITKTDTDLFTVHWTLTIN